MLNFFNKFNIINKNQFGFRQGHSTELAITKFYEDILTNSNNNQASFALFLDLSKAFDSVNRNILINKLHKYGIRGLPLDLIKSYLTDRFQYLEINNIQSEQCPTTKGVPQGSIISPLLFLILINDFKNATNMELINFADDTLIYCPISDTDNIERKLNDELKIIINWITINHLKLNYKKTNFLIFSPKTNKFKTLQNLKLLRDQNNNTIERKTQYKYLGLMVDQDLNWKSHILAVKTKLSKALGILYRVRSILNKPSLNKLLHSLIISHVKYGIICYGRANKTSLKPINILYNQGIRCVNFLKRTDKNIKQLYLDQNVLSLENTFKLEIGKFCFKAKHNLLPDSFTNFFTKIDEIHKYNTRNFKNRFYLKKQNKKSGLLTLAHTGAKVWNSFPTLLQNTNSVHSFSKNLKKYLTKS